MMIVGAAILLWIVGVLADVQLAYNECPKGFQKIKDKNQCELEVTAHSTLKYFGALNSTIRPPGCYCKHTNECWWNTNQYGKIDNNAMLLCKRCPEGGCSKMTRKCADLTKKECKKEGKDMGCIKVGKNCMSLDQMTDEKKANICKKLRKKRKCQKKGKGICKFENNTCSAA